MSRFVNVKDREKEKLFLPEREGQGEPDFIVVKKRLTNRERKQITTAGLKMTMRPGKAETAIVEQDIQSADFEKVLVTVMDWSFTNDDGEKVQLSRENLERLDEDSFAEIVNALDEWNTKREAEKNSRRPADGATPEPSSADPSLKAVNE